MAANERTDLASTDLPITLYLNQRLTFDILAVLQGGFSSFSTVQTSSHGETAEDSHGKVGLGVSNVFALLGVSASFQGSRKEGKTESQNTTEEIVHTPASLFAQLRMDLQNRNLVKAVSLTSDIAKVDPGDFVEFEATLRKNPLIDLLDAFSTLMLLARQFEPAADLQTSRKGRARQGGSAKASKSEREYATVNRQIDAIKSLVTTGGSLDFIAEMTDIRFVLTTEQNYFVDPSMNDIIDGTFRVFGKATRVVEESEEGISLFRRSAAAKFSAVGQALESAFEGLEGPELAESIDTIIRGPTMQVVPIAIFS